VELIDGLQLVHYWSLYMQKQAQELGHSNNDANDNNHDLKPA
jgi:hypothetical protein